MDIFRLPHVQFPYTGPHVWGGMCSEHLKIVTGYGEDWTERGRSRKVLKLGESLYGSLTDAAMHANSNTCTRTYIG